MKPENERTLMETNRLVKDRSQKSGSIQERSFLNPLKGTLKPHSNGPLYSNTVVGTLAVDGWAVRPTFGWSPAQSPPCCTKCNSPPINGQCTNFI